MKMFWNKKTKITPVSKKKEEAIARRKAQEEIVKEVLEKFKGKSFDELTEEEKKQLLSIAAKDFSTKFSKDIEVLANE